MNKLYMIVISVNNRTKFTQAALTLIENVNNTDVVIMKASEREFADSIADDIMDLNDGFIDGIDIKLTCMENLPYSRFAYGAKFMESRYA